MFAVSFLTERWNDFRPVVVLHRHYPRDPPAEPRGPGAYRQPSSIDVLSLPMLMAQSSLGIAKIFLPVAILVNRTVGPREVSFGMPQAYRARRAAGVCDRHRAIAPAGVVHGGRHMEHARPHGLHR